MHDAVYAPSAGAACALRRRAPPRSAGRSCRGARGLTPMFAFIFFSSHNRPAQLRQLPAAAARDTSTRAAIPRAASSRVGGAPQRSRALDRRRRQCARTHTKHRLQTSGDFDDAAGSDAAGRRYANGTTASALWLASPRTLRPHARVLLPPLARTTAASPLQTETAPQGTTMTLLGEGRATRHPAFRHTLVFPPGWGETPQ
jgi:hypothetical protein